MPHSCALLGGFAIVHGLHCYGNTTRMRNVSNYVFVLALWLVQLGLRHCHPIMYGYTFVQIKNGDLRGLTLQTVIDGRRTVSARLVTSFIYSWTQS